MTIVNTLFKIGLSNKQYQVNIHVFDDHGAQFPENKKRAYL